MVAFPVPDEKRRRAGEPGAKGRTAWLRRSTTPRSIVRRSLRAASPRTEAPCGYRSGVRGCGPALPAENRPAARIFTVDTAPHPQLFPLEDTPSGDTPLEDKVAVSTAEGHSPGAEGSGNFDNFAPGAGRVPVGSTDWRCCRRNTSPSSRARTAGLRSSAVMPVHSSKTVERPPGPLGQVVARSMAEPDPGPSCMVSAPALRD